MRTRAVCVLAALILSGAALGTAPPAPDGKKKSVPEGHAKASSFAPQPRSRHRAYGAPVQKPILSKRKRTRQRADKPAAK